MSDRANSTAHSEWSTYSSKSFISTKAFNAELYSYTLTRSGTPPFDVTGSLLVSGASAANCPAARVLHTNGKRLTPGANPMTAFTGGATVTTSRLMIGVYDPESMLNGFIDPTSSTFAVYDKNRPAADYLVDFTANTAEATALALLGGQGANLSLLTGNVANVNTANNNASTTANVGSSRSGTITLGSANTTIVVSSTSVTANSLIFLSVAQATPAAGTFAVNVSKVAGTSFTFASDASAKTVAFLILN